MSDKTLNNKRIAKNTIFLYFRMIFIMVVSLFTSRVVLNTLGVEDYGIYNVVGGIVAMFGFLNASMSSSTQRYIEYYILVFYITDDLHGGNHVCFFACLVAQYQRYTEVFGECAGAF